MKLQLEALQTAYEYIERLEVGITQCIEYFQANDIGAGNELLTQIIDGLGWVIEVLERTKQVQKQEISIHRITDILNEFLEAMQNNDSILICDLLEYEIAEGIGLWKDGIAISLKEHLGE